MAAPSARKGPTSSRCLSWDVIRVVALGFVVTGHVTGVAARVPGIEAYPFSVNIPFGTVTLLVLSGYFVGPTLRRGNPGRWLRARLARLLPAYLAALLLVYVVARCVVVGFNGWRHQPGALGLLLLDPVRPDVAAPGTLPPWHVPDLADLALHAMLLHLWNPDLYHRIDGSWWTMPVQVLAFTGAALLWRAGWQRKARPQAALWTVIGVSAVSPVLSLVLGHLPIASGLFYAHLFAVGLAIWLWQRGRLSSAHLLGMLLATLALHAMRTSPPTVASVTGFAIMLALMCLAARGPDWDLPGLRALRRPISWLAGIGFGIYLVHQALGYLVARALSEAGVSPWWLRLTVVVAFAILLGWLVTILVERPAYRVLTRPRAERAGAPRPGLEPPVSVGGAT